MRVLREAAGVSFGLSSNRLFLELGAIFLRTETELILKSRHVIPGTLQKMGFEFDFPEWPSAAHDLVRLQSMSTGTGRPVLQPLR